ncbi:MAG TPA: hypothetical protein VM537_03875 [Anaerolineae bacterium]|nr:hypothetical protein [Anaerolineae bacterium]
MKEKVKYSIYERSSKEKCWRWCASYPTLTEAWLALPLWREAVPGTFAHPAVEIVKLSVDLVAPPTLYPDTVRDHRIWDPRDNNSVPALRRLPVRDPSTPRL